MNGQAVCSQCRETNPAGSKFCRGCGNALSAPNEEVGVTPPLPAPQTTVREAPSEPSSSPANPVVGGASAPAKRVPVAVIVVVVALIAVGAGAAITLVATGSGHGSHATGAALTNAAVPGTATPETAATPGTAATPSHEIDSSAKTLAQTAQTAAVTLATEDNGSYASITPEKLKAVEPSIAVCSTSSGQACLSAATGTAKTYEVTATAQNTGDTFTVKSLANGEVEHKCVSTKEGCPGSTNSSNSW